MIACIPFDADAASLRLFSNGQQAADYNDSIKKLISSKDYFREKTYLLFDNASPVEVIRFLGKGGQTAVFQKADGRALRIPLASGNVFFRTGPNGELVDHGSYTKGMESYMAAMDKIGMFRAIVPQIYKDESRLPEYITVEFFNAKFNIREFFVGRDELIRSGLLAVVDVPKLEEALSRFAKRTARFKAIGDFKVEQLMTNGNSWRLLDASGVPRLAASVGDPTAFDHKNMGPKLPAEVYSWITQIVRAERKKNPQILLLNESRSCNLILGD